MLSKLIKEGSVVSIAGIIIKEEPYELYALKYRNLNHELYELRVKMNHEMGFPMIVINPLLKKEFRIPTPDRCDTIMTDLLQVGSVLITLGYKPSFLKQFKL